MLPSRPCFFAICCPLLQYGWFHPDTASSDCCGFSGRATLSDWCRSAKRITSESPAAMQWSNTVRWHLWISFWKRWFFRLDAASEGTWKRLGCHLWFYWRAAAWSWLYFTFFLLWKHPESTFNKYMKLSIFSGDSNYTIVDGIFQEYRNAKVQFRKHLTNRPEICKILKQ